MLTNALVTASLLSLIPPSWNSNVRVDFRVLDDVGRPVSNAVIRTYTQRDRIASMGHRSTPKREIVSVTDGEGRAAARFPCYDGQFSSCAYADGFYEERSGDVLFKRASDGVVIEHLLEHGKEIVFTLYPKKNPIAMYSNFGYDNIKLPILGEKIGYDVKVGDWVSPYGQGMTADFFVRYTESHTNGVLVGRSELLFNGLNGAYRIKRLPSTSIWSYYHADVAAEFLTHFEMMVKLKDNGSFLDRKRNILEGDEYLVLRTRAVTDSTGKLQRANYSKICGPMKIFTYFHFEQSCFNPTPNDPNLEFDEKRNLAPRRRRR